MQQADVSFLNEPYYIVAIPEYKSQHNIDVHVYRYDVPGKGWKSFALKYPSGSIPVKDATDTSYSVLSHKDENTEFKPLDSPELRIEKNIFQIKGSGTVDSTRLDVLMDINKSLQTDFTIHSFTLDEFKALLEKEAASEENNELATKTLKAFQEISEPLFKEHIARYYLLYTRGGVYLDPKSVLKKRLADRYFRLNLYDGFISIYDNSNGIPELNLMAFKKGSPFLKEVLEKATANVENRFYGNSSQEPTGTLCFRDCINKACGEGVLPRGIRELRYGDEKIFILRQEAGRLYDENNRPLWNRDVCSSFEKNITRFNSTPNYWLQCKLYPDGNCYSLYNWKYYMSETSDAQTLFFGAVIGIVVVCLVILYLTRS